MGAPYWSDGTGTVRLTPTDFEAKLLAAPFKELVQLSGPPRIVRDSRTSWSCTVYFNIHDSQTGARASQLIKRELMFGNAVCPIQGTRATAGTPHCMRCHRWGHPTTACMATKTVCAHCAGPHNEANHREAAACCQAKPKANPPVPATLAGVDCPHAPHCVNCGGDHLATARKCVFFRNRFDRKWINARYAQEPPWRLIRTAPSAASVEGEEVVGAPNHPQWLAMVRPPEPDTPPRVIAYVSTRLSAWRPSMRRDVIDHRDVLVLSLFAEGHTFNFMNVYSDSEFTAIRLLSDCADTLPQFHYMGGDFNCHSSVWDPVPRAPNVAASHWLLQAAAEIGLELATVANPGPTHIPRDVTKRPSVIDLVFLPVTLSAAVSTERVIDDQSDSDHIPLLTSVPISPAVQTATRRCLPSDPEKAQAFLDDLVTKLRLIVPDDVADTPDDVEAAAKAVADAFSAAWVAHSRDSNVTRRSNPWWNETCSTALQQHRASRDAGDWAQFRRTVKQAKRTFFDAQIAEIAVKSKRPWDLMNWVQQRKLPPCEAIQYQGQPCHDMSVLWDALHGTYNAASGRACDMSVLDPLPAAPAREWLPFSQFELTDALASCSNRSAPGPDHIKWTHLKYLVKDAHCHKRLLYRSCVIPIATYGFRLWYFGSTKNKGAIKTLNSMQRQAALWITGAFRTSPSGGIEALAGLMPLHKILAKLASGSITRVVSLSDTHPVRSLMSGQHLKRAVPHASSIELMTPAIKAKVKGSLMQADMILPAAVELVEPFHKLAQPGLRLLDRFSDRIMFDAPSRSPPPLPPPPGDGPSAEDIMDARMMANALIRDFIDVPPHVAALAAMPVPKAPHIRPIGLNVLARAHRHAYLNAFLKDLEEEPDTIHAAVDGSLSTTERLQATVAVYIHRQAKCIHRNRLVAGRVTAHDAELLAIRSAVVQCTQYDAKRIVIFTDAIGSARVAVDPSPHSGQAHSLAVCEALQQWFQGDLDRSITFVDVPSALRWAHHGQAHAYASQLRVPYGRDPALTINSIRQTTDLWREQEWKNNFLHSPSTGTAFLRLRGVDGTQLQPSSKGGPWIKLAGSDNALFARMCRCVLNHAPIGSYYTRFNIDSPTQCSCGRRQDREHILVYCRQYTRTSDEGPALGAGLVRFLKENPSAFAFPKPEQGVG
ncbi:hypothetical protein D9619_008864 [Psilocybe cf. subviscida]|uniref:Endonuclease/exonuclease/phosphatase domain-containing protein n=1 Tax=Psilocybe cf. subviscida TaxID=2480587 RepID=A0A8H5F142_9AGAR|nr:hypothetical protein D9619_008864 [Psilocybe cf. subviscida]